MAYCRFSSDNFESDLYCYRSEDGWVTHVAGNRIVGKVPPLPALKEDNVEEWINAYKAQERFLDTCKMQPIGGPYDNQSFLDKSLDQFYARLLRLRNAGYKVPDWVLKDVYKEMMGKTES